MSAAPPPPSLHYLASLPRSEVAKVSRRIKDPRKRAKFLGLILKARVTYPPHDCASKPPALSHRDKLEALPPAPARLRGEQEAIDAYAREMCKRVVWFLNRAQPDAFALIQKDSRKGHLRERSTQMIESVVRLREAEELGVHPKIAIGRFNGNELVHVMTSDDAGCKSWSRERNESAELFCERVVRDLAERAGLQHAALAASG